MDSPQPITEQKPEQKVGLKELAVSIVSADEMVFEGTVYMLTSINKDGEFDVLPLHTNFITLIRDTIILHQTNKEKKEITITNGVLKVAENRVNIILGPFVGADILPEDLQNDQLFSKKSNPNSLLHKLKFLKREDTAEIAKP